MIICQFLTFNILLNITVLDSHNYSLPENPHMYFVIFFFNNVYLSTWSQDLCLIHDKNIFTMFSMINGGTFSPPEVIKISWNKTGVKKMLSHEIPNRSGLENNHFVVVKIMEDDVSLYRNY